MRRREFIVRTGVGGAAVMALGPGLLAGCTAPRATGSRRLASGWRFHRGELSAEMPSWEEVRLPHTARIEAVVTGPPGSDTFQWQGVCWYEREIRVTRLEAQGIVQLHFEGAMNNARVLLDGEEVGSHRGGFLPFVIDLTGRVRGGETHLLQVRLDNTDDPVTGPKPLRDLDFNMYGGLYRHVRLITKERLHITNPIWEQIPGGGGIFVTYPEASKERALVRIQTHVRNAHDEAHTVEVVHTLTGSDGTPLLGRAAGRVAAGGAQHLVAEIEVEGPALWDPDNPNLYTLSTELRSGARVVDSQRTRIGIRRIHIDVEGFRINGERRFLRGTNRHQEYPHLGYALSDAAQYRDAKLIKDAGFDYVRLSHYPHATAFMEACDELGLVVMDCIPGWQYFNYDNARFTEIQLENCRQMMRRDRNHPCVILWEVSLNETWMPEEFIEATKQAAAEEYPGDQCYTCGWMGSYDVFIQARQHGGCREVTDRPCVVSEYGDWEYYAMNAGLNQTDFADLALDESNSRQMRWHGERALLQQAANFQEAHNDNRKTIAFADGLWVMFDYNRGYAPDIESSGCADLFRVPKFSYDFFRSQRSAAGLSGAMVAIAGYWTPDSPTPVRVFSNCDEVELRVNGRVVARQGPDANRMTTNLAHPPFTFEVAFEAGTLEAVGFLNGEEAAEDTVHTPNEVAALRIEWALQGLEFAAGGRDVAFVRAHLVDENGTTNPDAWENVGFGVIGNAEIVGRDIISTDAGIASALVRGNRDAAAYAVAAVPVGDHTAFLAAGLGPSGPAPAFSLRVTTDGLDPGPDSPLYDGPVSGDDARAAIVVAGEVVATVAANQPRTRVPGSIAPESHGEFHY